MPYFLQPSTVHPSWALLFHGSPNQPLPCIAFPSRETMIVALNGCIARVKGSDEHSRSIKTRYLAEWGSFLCGWIQTLLLCSVQCFMLGHMEQRPKRVHGSAFPTPYGPALCVCILGKTSLQIQVHSSEREKSSAAHSSAAEHHSVLSLPTAMGHLIGYIEVVVFKQRTHRENSRNLWVRREGKCFENCSFFFPPFFLCVFRSRC